MTLAKCLSERLFRKIVNHYVRMAVSGESAIQSGHYILCSNHSSHADSVLLMMAGGGSFDDYSLIAAQDYWFENKIRKTIIGSLLNLIPIDRRPKERRQVSFSESTTISKKALSKSKDHKLIFYGSGTRTNKASPIKPGIVLLAAQLNIPVIPITINNSDIFYGKHAKWFTPCNISVTFHDPITVNMEKSVDGTYLDSDIESYCKVIQSAIESK